MSPPETTPALAGKLPIREFLRAFPFYLAWDVKGVIVEVGPSLPKVCPEIAAGKSLNEVLRLVRPQGALSATFFAEHPDQLFIVADRSNDRLLRGSYLALDSSGVGVLLATPWMTGPDQITEYGLTQSDFAVHDQTLDLLLLQQTQHMAANDLRQLNAKLIAKREQLIEQEARVRQSEREARQQRDEARRQRDELEWIHNNAPIGLCYLDSELRYRRVNRYLADINGLPVEAHIGRRIAEIVPAIASRVEEEARSVMATRRPARYENVTVTSPLQPGVTRYFNESWFPLFDDCGEVAGLTLLVEEVTDRKRVRVLREADLRKNEFLATLAHELRNPLAPIKSALQLVQMTDSDDPAIRRENIAALGIAERQVDHLVRLVDDLLEVARITHGKIELRKAQTDICEILPQALDLARPHLEKKRHSLSYKAPTLPLPVVGDTVRLVQVFANLLDNAIKYTTPEGAIALCATREGPDAVVRVRDNGRGIPPDKLASIWDMFSQVEYAREAKGGIGIGLAIARTIVHLHNGRVGASSAGVGLGSEFYVAIPLAVSGVTQTVEG